MNSELYKDKRELLGYTQAEHAALEAVAEAAENSFKGHTESKLAAGRLELRRCLANLAAIRGQKAGGK